MVETDAQWRQAVGVAFEGASARWPGASSTRRAMSSPTSQRVPFLLRSGKALGSARQDILIHFKEVAAPADRAHRGTAPSCLRTGPASS
ncbi:MAG: hypothetical protein WA006_03350 [Rhodoglobus sp.]